MEYSTDMKCYLIGNILDQISPDYELYLFVIEFFFIADPHMKRGRKWEWANKKDEPKGHLERTLNLKATDIRDKNSTTGRIVE